MHVDKMRSYEVMVSSVYLFFVCCCQVHSIILRKTTDTDLVRTDAFVESLKITNDLKKIALTNYLLYCPSGRLCHYDTSSLKDFYNLSILDECCTPCSCDKTCHSYKTCCPDILDYEEHVTLATSDEMRKDCVKPQFFTSLSPFNKIQSKYMYLMVTKCIASWSEMYSKNMCQKVPGFKHFDFQTHLPVSNIRTNITYRNIFCARCNDISDEDLIYWTVNISNVDENDANLDYPEFKSVVKKGWKSCNIIYQPLQLSFQPETCFQYDHRSCDLAEPGTKEYIYTLLCQRFIATYNFNGKNVFCYLCKETLRRYGLGSVCIPNNPPGVIDGWRLRDFTVLFDFQNHPSKRESDTTYTDYDSFQNNGTKGCLENQKFDEYEMVCRNITCSEGVQYNAGQCGHFILSGGYRSYEIVVRLSPVNPIRTKVGRFQDFLRNYFETFLERLGTLEYLCFWELYVKDSDQTNEPSFVVVRLNVGYANMHNQFDFLDAILELEGAVVTLNHNVSEPLVLNMSIDNKIKDFNLIPSGRQQTKILYRLNKFQYEQNLGNLCKFPVRLMRVSLLSQCPQVCVNMTADNKGRVCHNHLNLCLEYNQYFVENGVVCMCEHRYFQSVAHWEKNNSLVISLDDGPECVIAPMSDVKSIVSAVFSGISIFLLILTLIVYCCLPALRTLPGKNIMALTTTLLFAQLIYVLGIGFTRNRTVCIINGGLIHYTWLCVFFWMNACTYHMMKSLNTIRASRDQSNSFVKNCCYTFLTPLAFVLCNVLVSMTLSDFTDIGYGGCVCYISSPMMVLYTFFCPALIIVLVNILIFLVSVYNISSLPDVSTYTRQKRNVLILYTKMSSLTGIYLLVVLLNGLFESVILTYTAIILDASIGAYIFFAFVCNRRTLKMISMLLTSTPTKEPTLSNKQIQTTRIK